MSNLYLETLRERGADMKQSKSSDLYNMEKDLNLTPSNLVSRRKLLKGLAIGAAAVSVFPAIAFGDNAKVNAAKDREAEAQEKLDKIAQESEDLNIELSKTYTDLADVHERIEKVEAEIIKRKNEISKRQAILEKRMVRDYKNGSSSFLSLLLNASSFAEFTSNLFYFEKITNSDKKLIEEINAQKEQLAQTESKLHSERKDLEQLQERLKEQKAEVDKKQEEAAQYLESCSHEVQEAINERDAEIAAAAEQRRRQQEAMSRPAYVPEESGIIQNNSGSLSAVLSAAQVVPSPGLGLCAMWVSRVFSAAGFSYPSGNANDMPGVRAQIEQTYSLV